MNALGYLPSQDVVYGVGAHGHVVRIDRSGGVTDLGDPHGLPREGLTPAVAGAVVGGALVVRMDDRLFTIDVTQSSRTYLSVTRTARLRPEADGLDDFAVDPVDGLLYGVNTTHGPPTVVSVDPASGAVRAVATPAGLPHGSTYGAAVIDSARTLYVVDNNDGNRSRLFAIPRGGAARELSSAPPVHSSDAAGCLSTAAPPPPPPPPPPTTTPPAPRMPTTTTTPPPAPVTTTPRPPSPTSAPVVVTGPPWPQQPVVTPTTTTPTTTTKRYHAVAAPAVKPVDHEERTRQRRWALTAVILLVGGGAATHAATRARHR